MLLRSLPFLLSFALPLQVQAAGDSLAPKPGLWEQVITGDRTPEPINLKVCVGEPEPGANPFSPQGDGEDVECRLSEATRTAGGMRYQSVCALGEGTMTSKGTITGDLNSRYQSAGTIEVSGVPMPPGAPRISRIQVAARYLGACPAGVEPGDIVP